jgi:transposase
MKSKAPKYAIKHFMKEFPNDDACLEWIKNHLNPDGINCKLCKRITLHHKMEKRRSYCCDSCGNHYHPTAGTIFHKSPTPLKLWFFAMLLMTASKNGVSAKELERQIGVTYKCAWRMAHQIRKLMNENPSLLQGIVEADETYIGGRRPGKRGRGAAGKTAVIGLLERGGSVIAKAVTNVKTKTVIPNISDNVQPGSTIVTDELPSYRRLPNFGFKHETVNHSTKEWVRAHVHTNSIEGFWSQLKRSINGTFHHVSKKHLQKYVNEFSYRYNRRKSETPMFYHLISEMAALPMRAT